MDGGRNSTERGIFDENFEENFPNFGPQEMRAKKILGIPPPSLLKDPEMPLRNQIPAELFFFFLLNFFSLPLSLAVWSEISTTQTNQQQLSPSEYLLNRWKRVNNSVKLGKIGVEQDAQLRNLVKTK